MSKYAIDLGHGVAYDSGAVSNLIKEETIIDSVGSLVINKLRTMGHSVVEVRPWIASSLSNSLTERTTKANNNNVDYYISIHSNTGGEKGTEVYTYRGREVSVARKILNNIVALGFINRGIKDGSNLAVIRNTSATAILIDICFIDTESDVNLYKNLGAEKISDAIVKGLVGSTVPSNSNSIIEDNDKSTVVSGLNSNNPTISELQGELNKQFNSGLVVDNIAGSQTLEACINVSYGAKGNITLWIQKKLNLLGYKCGVVDGIFGDNTNIAVKSYQKDKGLISDGIVGKNTWSELLGLS